MGPCMLLLPDWVGPAALPVVPNELNSVTTTNPLLLPTGGYPACAAPAATSPEARLHQVLLDAPIPGAPEGGQREGKGWLVAMGVLVFIKQLEVGTHQRLWMGRDGGGGRLGYKQRVPCCHRWYSSANRLASMA